MGSKKDIIEQNQDNIQKWLNEGMSIKSIADALGMSKKTFYKWTGMQEQGDTIKKGRQPAVEKLENTMFQSAIGYTRKVKRYMKVKRVVYENGRKAEEWEDVKEYEEEIYYPPDNTAGIFLLKNWGKYMNEPATVELRKEEVALKKKQLEANDW